ncbi:MAG: hypothetical protein QN152_04465 [Armatimonadota bacterium]|nr:hypothetical protein [Armatimonadota bacterium]MDR7428030.1 hypothetical protein [Armatimonadota bacterium]MDR7464269.1 hypothetical protein [Armatimonadota bacterium]MDR7470690.1 hypothetical protein [Armatimonadota bacterium]MDR7474455.1 hypothetical protein [Armatimonadota bacterium]
MTFNPVTRGDLRWRLASPKILWALRVYLAALGLFVLVSLPPEGGRLAGMAPGQVLQVGLVLQLVCVVYLTSALAVGEIGVQGEKQILDLALTSFSPRTIALGKLWTSALTAGGLVAVSVPLWALVAPPQLEAVLALGRAMVAMVPVALLPAAAGAWLTAAVSSDLARTVVHWVILLLLFLATRWLTEPLAVLSPVWLLGAAHRGLPHWPLALLPYAAGAAAAAGLAARTVGSVRKAGAP